MPPSSSSTPEEKAEKNLQPSQPFLGLQTPPVTPSVSPLKRKRNPVLRGHAGIKKANIAVLGAAETWNVVDCIQDDDS